MCTRPAVATSLRQSCSSSPSSPLIPALVPCYVHSLPIRPQPCKDILHIHSTCRASRLTRRLAHTGASLLLLLLKRSSNKSRIPLQSRHSLLLLLPKLRARRRVSWSRRGVGRRLLLVHRGEQILQACGIQRGDQVL